jgi:hypothetical protein
MWWLALWLILGGCAPKGEYLVGSWADTRGCDVLIEMVGKRPEVVQVIGRGGEPHIVVDSEFKACRDEEASCDAISWTCIVPSTKEEYRFTSTRVTPLEIRYQREGGGASSSGALHKE